MVCDYLRHIDLQAVYEQLLNYEPGLSSPELANIPPQLSGTLAPYFVELAEYTTSLLDGPPRWRHWETTDLAAHIGDLIEEELDSLGNGTTHQPPLADAELTAAAVESLLSFSSEAADTQNDYMALTCLLIYQYDCLCALYTSEQLANVLALFESIADTREAITSCQVLGSNEYMRSRRASNLAGLRHAETNQSKAAALTAWDQCREHMSSMAAFARARHKEFSVTERTLYGWIREYNRASR